MVVHNAFFPKWDGINDVVFSIDNISDTVCYPPKYRNLQSFQELLVFETKNYNNQVLCNLKEFSWSNNNSCSRRHQQGHFYFIILLLMVVFKQSKEMDTAVSTYSSGKFGHCYYKSIYSTSGF
jgi:hypothetical protein